MLEAIAGGGGEEKQPRTVTPEYSMDRPEGGIG